jgi:site-specific recombinase XerD
MLCIIKLNYYIARNTFVITVTLSNRVSIESVSKMLGHKKMRMIQYYAKILDKRLSDEMQKLRRSWHDNNRTRS